MNETIKNAGKTFLKSLVPLILTFLGTVLGGLFGTDTTLTTAVGAALGVGIYDKV
ncbi:MAG: hypothetical protein ACI4VW_00525 [Acutalibacteraceae bacterium]